VKGRLEMLKKPNGTNKFPARTCKDLYMSYPDLPSGTIRHILSIVMAMS